ncbi:vomeronasal type-2 receptor 26-like [Xenopus laevis]|uniref:Vomeronasal type-2 receptor 26-like n=2 Tax=Xenopus laevis TaxID=8355 RepID=A0A8J1KU45_XENLA|nr:vomeronasal type-2 receptor 26-like [Xenopus laevis]
MQMNPTCHTKTLEYFTFVNDDYDEDPELTIRDDMNHGKKTYRESSQTLIIPLGVTNTKNPMPCQQHRYPLHKRNQYIFPIIASTDNPNKRTSLPLISISYSTTDPALNDRIQFPSFYRTIPNEEAEIDGIVQILKHFGWKWEGEIPGFEQFFHRFSPNRYKDDLTINTWAWLFGCNFPRRVSVRLQTGEMAKDCTGNETLSDADLNKYIRNLTFTTSTGDTVFFNDNGDPPSAFDIVKWFFLPTGRVMRQKVGKFYQLNSEKQFYINSRDEVWGPYFKKIPTSQCNEPCSPGYRKSKIEGKPSCCYDCIKCADGEMSNITDAANCVRCSEYQKSNTERTECLLKAVNFLSYTDTMGVSFTSIALIFFIIASTVLGIFVKYWGTPIVKANNQNLSCILLISLMLCFLCTLLFIGRPTQICCLLRQVTFGIVFTISVSSILTKTLTVIIAFNATKPGSKLKKYVGTKVPIVLVIICSLGSSVISAVWMASHPPFYEADTFSEMDTVILMCNEGSVSLFFCVIGYIGTLALLSFIAAFLAKDFPDRFNEAKNITFSMLVFCSVWVAFVPVYLSSKGSRMVAVEIFAILSSSAGLLGCIFVPKCYIIFLRPEINTRTF